MRRKKNNILYITGLCMSVNNRLINTQIFDNIDARYVMCAPYRDINPNKRRRESKLLRNMYIYHAHIR